MKIMYIHGYGSTGNAMKGQLLRRMLPECEVVSPTFDYIHATPWQIQDQIRETVTTEGVGMLVGSSFGGYHTLCATTFFRGPVWLINPVRDVMATIKRAILSSEGTKEPIPSLNGDRILELYADFDMAVFARQVKENQCGNWSSDTRLNFALSTDDELLGDHRIILEMFPRHDKVIWKDNSGHRFYKFEELKEYLLA